MQRTLVARASLPGQRPFSRREPTRVAAMGVSRARMTSLGVAGVLTFLGRAGLPSTALLLSGHNGQLGAVWCPSPHHHVTSGGPEPPG